MITLITAVPGSGKSLTAIEIIVNSLSENPDRKIYTNLPLKWSEPNLDDLTEKPYLLIDPNGKNVFPIPDGDDWQLCEMGSLIIYDEVQKIFPATAKAGVVVDDRLTGLETHRHHGYDLVFITQDATFVHHHIRKLVGRHIHLYRGHNATRVARYSWSHYETDPNDRHAQERATMEVWAFRKDLYKYYKSSVKHTHIFKLPKKAYFFIVVILMILGLVGYLISKNGSVIKLPSSEIVPSETSQSVSGATVPVETTKTLPNLIDVEPDMQRQHLFSTAPTAVPIEGCIQNKNFCSCYDKSGLTLELTYNQCSEMMRTPLPRQINTNNTGAQKVR